VTEKPKLFRDRNGEKTWAQSGDQFSSGQINEHGVIIIQAESLARMWILFRVFHPGPSA